jgi:hypothetical protein
MGQLAHRHHPHPVVGSGVRLFGTAAGRLTAPFPA